MDYPLRPAPGTIIDLDVLMKHCNFEENKVQLLQRSTIFVIIDDRFSWGVVRAGLS